MRKIKIHFTLIFGLLLILTSSNFIALYTNSSIYSSKPDISLQAEEEEGHYNKNCRELGEWSGYYGEIIDIEIITRGFKTYAFLACYTGGIFIIDLSVPSEPIILNHILISHQCYSLFLSESLLFVGCAYGLIILNIDNIGDPEIIYDGYTSSVFDTVYSVYVHENLLFLGTINNGLLIYDISDFNNIISLYHIYVGQSVYIRKILVNNDLLYLGLYNRVEIYDISEPFELKFITAIITTNEVYSLALENNLLAISMNMYGLYCYNISDIKNPKLLYKFKDYERYISDVLIYEEKIFLVSENYGLIILNYTDDFSFSMLLNLKLPYGCFRAYLDEPYLYVANHEMGFYVYEIDNYESLQMVSSVRLNTYNSEIFVTQGAAFTTNGLNSIFVYNVRNPGAISFSGIYCDEESHYDSIFVKGKYAYLFNLNKKSLDVIKVNRPDRMYKVSEYSLKDYFMTPYCSNIMVQDQYAYVLVNDYYYGAPGFYVFDISDPKNIKSVGNFSVVSQNAHFVLKDNYVFIEGHIAIYVFDIANLTAIRKVATIYHNQIINDFTMDIDNNLLFVADDKGFTIYNIRNFDQIEEIISYKINAYYDYGVEKIDFIDDHLYVLTHKEGLIIYNTKEIDVPRVEGQYYDIENPGSIASSNFGENLINFYINNKIVYLACGSEGLKIVSLERYPIAWVSDYYNISVAVISILSVTVVFLTIYTVVKNIIRHRRR